ncbi:DUF262 domain-containing protein [Bradyrhizobium japonicum]|uniref:DUF262 domain-containing protein n=1 Tax=Bradyrhizobium japonicum TaxID=375 RepID=UPI001BADB444|nr:DUF262 domain-containing protein [Bradyrhizobium japonicum]MBR0734426.1 DUF262 domain-containing protein [Bradyrhizobium japonicum]
MTTPEAEISSEIDRGQEDDESGLNAAVLEDKYREQMRQIHPTKIDLPMLTLEMQIDKQIDLRPDFQRRDRWTNEKRSRFIESLIMNVPVPPVFLGEEEYGKYVVLDGRQRLTAAYRFLRNDLRLEGLKVWTELNGLNHAEFQKKGFGPTLDRRFLPAVLLTRESSPEVKYEVFDRLNTGGVKAEPMEVRNAVFPGPFKDLLHVLSADDRFRRLWGIPVGGSQEDLETNGLYRDMSDLELVLRFFALRKATLQEMRFKDRLSDVMSTKNKLYQADPKLKEEDAHLFLSALENAHTIFGNDAFRRSDKGSGSGRRSAPYADSVMQALADIPTETFANQQLIEAVRNAFHNLLSTDDEFVKAISTGTNGETAINKRITAAKEIVRLAISGPKQA